MHTTGRPGKNKICILSSHRATRELYAKVPSHRASHRALVGALCEGSMRIELRSELYVKGALCGSTDVCFHFCQGILFYAIPLVKITSTPKVDFLE